MNTVLAYAPALTLAAVILVLGFGVLKMSAGLHQLRNAKIAGQSAEDRSELRMRGRSNVYSAIVGFVGLILIGVFYLYGAELAEWMMGLWI